MDLILIFQQNDGQLKDHATEKLTWPWRAMREHLHSSFWPSYLPRILLARCSLEVMIWSMSVRMTASMAGRASCSLDSTSSKCTLACSNTRRYTASEICG